MNRPGSSAASSVTLSSSVPAVAPTDGSVALGPVAPTSRRRVPGTAGPSGSHDRRSPTSDARPAPPLAGHHDARTATGTAPTGTRFRVPAGRPRPLAARSRTAHGSPRGSGRCADSLVGVRIVPQADPAQLPRCAVPPLRSALGITAEAAEARTKSRRTLDLATPTSCRRSAQAVSQEISKGLSGIAD